MSSVLPLRAPAVIGRDSVLRRLGVFSVLAIAALAVWPAWRSLAQVWGQVDDYSHGYLIVGVALGWLWLRSRHLPPPATRMQRLACVLLVGCIAAWLIAWKGGIATGIQVLAPAVVWLALWMTFGWTTALRLAAPLAYVYFAIPVWELLVPLLQQITVAVTERALGLLGVPARIDGVFVSIPEGRFVVEEGCSGRRFLIVSLAVSSLLVGIWSLRGWRALTFLGVTVFLALLANWVRVVIVVHAGHVSHMQSYLVAREHVTLGWLIFALLLALVYFVGSQLAGPRQREVAAQDDLPVGMTHGWGNVAATVAILCLPLVAIGYAGSRAAPLAGQAIELRSIDDGRWLGPVAPEMDWSPRYPGASSQRRAAYRSSGGAIVEVFVAEYATQHQNAELINYTNSLGGEGWTALHNGLLDMDSGALRTQVVEDRAGAHRLIAYVYQVGSALTTSAARVELAYGSRSWIEPTPVRVIAMALPCQTLCDDERKYVSDLWKSIRPTWVDALEKRS